MKYALKLAEDGRVLSATYPEYAAEGLVEVEGLPEGDISEYRYENGEFIHDPVQEEASPTPLTIEERVAALEKTVTVPDYTAGTWYYRGDKVRFEQKVYTCIAPEGVVCVWSPSEYPTYWQ